MLMLDILQYILIELFTVEFCYWAEDWWGTGKNNTFRGGQGAALDYDKDFWWR